MAKKEETGKAKAQKNEAKAPKEKRSSRTTAVFVFIIIIIFAIAGGVVYGYNNSGSQSSFSTFQSNFNSAPKVGIVVTGNDGPQLGAGIGCSTQLIQQIVSNKQYHRNATSIYYYIINQTTCLYTAGGLGSYYSNATKATPKQCVNLTKNSPTIFINYSSGNSTRTYPTALYVQGDVQFLQQCAIASEIT